MILHPFDTLIISFKYRGLSDRRPPVLYGNKLLLVLVFWYNI